MSSQLDFGGFLTSPILSCPYDVVKLSPAMINFRTLLVGNTSAPQSITLTNVGSPTLSIGTISQTGSADFLLSNNSCDNADLGMGESCSFDVAFTPSTVGNISGAAIITDNAPGSPQMVMWNGMGIALSASPPPVLKSPKNAALVYKAPVKLTWKGAKKPFTGYHIQINSSSDFMGTSYADQDVLPKKPRFTVGGLPFGIYTWHVAVRDASGQSVYSAPFSFEVTLNKAPKKGVTLKNGAVRFKWQAVKGKTYDLEVYTLSTDNPPVRTVILNPQGLKNAGYAVDKLMPLTTGTYSWRVRPTGGDWTLPWSFNIP